ncbi:MAG: hypothetical protein ACRD5D_06870 [Candidatus Polarisedimenticolia bacterium]
MRRYRVVRSLFAVILALPAGVAEPGARSGGPVVAIVRDDGVILPFARYADGEWTTPWPSPAAGSMSAERGDPVKRWLMAEGRLLEEWRVHTGPKAGKTRIKGVTEVANHCVTSGGLATDLPAARRSRGLHRNLGIAVSDGLDAQPLNEIKHHADETRALAGFLQKAFAESDRAALEARPKTAAGNPAAADFGSFEVRTLRRSNEAVGRGHLYFVSAVRPHGPMTAADACPYESLFQGWFTRSGRGEPEWIDRKVEIGDCDGKATSLLTPLGLLEADGDDYVVVEEQGYESETYAIYTLGKEGVKRLHAVPGGGC